MKILQQLSEAMGVSGAEGEVRRIIVKLIEKHVDDLHIDTMGNLIVRKKAAGKSKLTVMLDAHMDEVGLMVNGYDSNGMLKVVSVGGLDDRILLGTRWLVGPDKFPGVIGVKPIHLTEGDERDKVIKIDAMRIDIGADSKEAAERKAPLGTRLGFESEFVDLGTMARGKAFDDRAGCATLVHVLQGKRYPFEVVGSFSVQEEIGTRGAKVAAHRVNPDLCVVLEGTIADDLPKREEDSSPTTMLGKGPALSLMDHSTLYDARLNEWLVSSAEAAKIPFQFKQPGVGGTNGAAIHLAQDGIPVAVVSAPCRYIHTPTAMLNKRDYQNAAKLVSAALDRLDGAILKR